MAAAGRPRHPSAAGRPPCGACSPSARPRRPEHGPRAPARHQPRARRARRKIRQNRPDSRGLEPQCPVAMLRAGIRVPRLGVPPFEPTTVTAVVLNHESVGRNPPRIDPVMDGSRPWEGRQRRIGPDPGEGRSPHAVGGPRDGHAPHRSPHRARSTIAASAVSRLRAKRGPSHSGDRASRARRPARSASRLSPSPAARTAFAT